MFLVVIEPFNYGRIRRTVLIISATLCASARGPAGSTVGERSTDIGADHLHRLS